MQMIRLSRFESNVKHDIFLNLSKTALQGLNGDVFGKSGKSGGGIFVKFFRISAATLLTNLDQCGIVRSLFVIVSTNRNRGQDNELPQDTGRNHSTAADVPAGFFTPGRREGRNHFQPRAGHSVWLESPSNSKGFVLFRHLWPARGGVSGTNNRAAHPANSETG